VFTKALSKHQHHFLVDKLMLLDHIASIWGGDINGRNYGSELQKLWLQLWDLFYHN
jgi:hypothetical protein